MKSLLLKQFSLLKHVFKVGSVAQKNKVKQFWDYVLFSDKLLDWSEAGSRESESTWGDLLDDNTPLDRNPHRIPMLDTHAWYSHKTPTQDTHTRYPCMIPTHDTPAWYSYKIPVFIETHTRCPRLKPMFDTHTRSPCLRTNPNKNNPLESSNAWKPLQRSFQVQLDSNRWFSCEQLCRHFPRGGSPIHLPLRLWGSSPCLHHPGGDLLQPAGDRQCVPLQEAERHQQLLPGQPCLRRPLCCMLRHDLQCVAGAFWQVILWPIFRW